MKITPAINANIHDGMLVKESKSSGLISMPILLFFGIVLFFLWASYFKIDQSVRAQGQVISRQRTQIIQVVDGGVLAKLFVYEGDRVKAGQLLAVLEKQRANAGYEESRSSVAALDAALVRARAETLGKSPKYDKKFKDYPEFVEAQLSLYRQRRQSLQDQLDTLKKSHAMAQEEFEMNRSLLATGDASRLEVMRAQRQVAEIYGEIIVTQNKYLEESHRELARLEAELGVARHKLEERQSLLEHTNIIAPTTGIIKYLQVNTLGGVLRAGDELMQISPTQSEMIVEVKVNPADIGDLSLGLPASIKLDAFDYSIYGSVEGTLSYISSDTLTETNDDQVATYYRAQISIESDFAQVNSKFSNVALKPGMTVSVDIKTGRRTVLHYLAKPLTRAFSGALNER